MKSATPHISKYQRKQLAKVEAVFKTDTVPLAVPRVRDREQPADFLALPLAPSKAEWTARSPESGLIGFKRNQPDTYQVLCPFHDDHRPSCVVQTDRSRFYCYSCGENGKLRKLMTALQKPKV